MTVIRANDPRANDIPHQIKTILGQMCDTEISIESKQKYVERLTGYMKGLPMSEDTFHKLGIAAKLVRGDRETTLHVLVPKEYVASGITENRDSQWIVFTINRATNVENLHDSDTAYVTDMEGNPVNADEADIK